MESKDFQLGSWQYGKVIGGGNKKLKVDQSDLRLQCHVSCGANHVVENVWPYLLPPDFVRSQLDEDNSDDDDVFDNDSDEDEDNDNIENFEDYYDNNDNYNLLS